VPVYDVSNASDSAWVDGYFGDVLYGSGSSPDISHVWLVNYDGTSTVNKIVRRNINTTTLANTTSNVTTEPFVITQDFTYTQSITVGGSFVMFGGVGLLAFAGDPTDGNGHQQVVVNLMTENSTSPTSVTLTSNTNSNIAYNLKGGSCGWWQSGYFYLVYVTTTSGSETGLSLQAVATNGSTLYKSPISVVNYTNANIGSSQPICGPSSESNSPYLYIAYKDTTLGQIIQYKIDPSFGGIVNITNLTTDTTHTTYYPVGIISTNSITGTLVSNARELLACYNETNTLTSIPLTVPTGYQPSAANGLRYLDGFAIIQPMTSNDNPTIWSMMSFNPDGTTRSIQALVGFTEGNANAFVDVNGSIWFGYMSYDYDTGYTLEGYLGQLLGTPSFSGRALASLFTFIFFVVASLFVF